ACLVDDAALGIRVEAAAERLYEHVARAVELRHVVGREVRRVEVAMLVEAHPGVLVGAAGRVQRLPEVSAWRELLDRSLAHPREYVALLVVRGTCARRDGLDDRDCHHARAKR